MGRVAFKLFKLFKLFKKKLGKKVKGLRICRKSRKVSYRFGFLPSFFPKSLLD